MIARLLVFAIGIDWVLGLTHSIGFGSLARGQEVPDTADIQESFNALREGKYFKSLTILERRAQNNSQSQQELATLRSFVGDCRGALEAMRGIESRESTAEATLAESFASASAIPAVEAIVEAARSKQIVILNEAHHVPRHRAFALRLAIRLRELGFEFLAAETFSPFTQALEKRGYPDLSTGYYTNEPVFGEFVRESLRLGYRPIAYEMLRQPPPEADQLERVNHREEEQCKNLIDQIFSQNPQAKALIYVGYSHATEDVTKLSDGRELAWMAARLKSQTGLDPLTIDQTVQTEDLSHGADRNPWRELLDRNGRTDSTVFQMSDQSFLVFGDYAGKVDLQVIHPPSKIVQGRPDWLLELPGRKAVTIPGDVISPGERVLVQAFLDSETENAVPVDQVLVNPASASPVLVLPEGRYRIVSQSEDGTTKRHGQLTVDSPRKEKP